MVTETSSTHRVCLDDFDAWLFDLDGVLTDTARLHERAWSEVFSEHAGKASANDGHLFRPFTDDDYRRLVDGELPTTAVRNVLADRGTPLPEGAPDDPPTAESVWGLVNQKDARYKALLAVEGPRPFESSVSLLQDLHDAGVDVAVVSASRHCAEVLERAGLSDLVDVRVDGQAARAMGLAGKPDPAAYLEACVRLGVDPDRAAVVEDALAGVAAGHAGGFRMVVGVDRTGQEEALRSHGADIVVGDLGALSLEGAGPAQSPWRLCYRDPSPAEEGVVETLCTLANGYFGTRGARPWSHDDGTSYPGTYVAGLYNRLESEIDGQSVELESLVNAPNWVNFSLRPAGGVWLGTLPDLDGMPGGGAGAANPPRVLTHLVRLDLRNGVLLRRCTVVDAEGRHSAIVERRIVSMAEPHIAAQELTVVPLDWSGQVELYAALKGDVRADETTEERLLANTHLESVDEGAGETSQLWLRVRTTQSQVMVAIATRCRLRGRGGQPAPATGPSVGRRSGAVWQTWVWEAAPGSRITLEKVTAIHTSRDCAISEPKVAAREAVASAPAFSKLLSDHSGVWARIWRKAAVTLSDGSSASGATLDLHLFHLLQVASPHVVTLDVGIGARGLHGEGYRGHVFWDTVFAFQVLDQRFPDVARALLNYRSRRLVAARRAAAAAGFAGAMFPWQSGSDGREETPSFLYNPRTARWIPDRSRYQRHVGLAIAYCTWQHWQATGDVDFLAGQGVELMVEVARCFASMAVEDRSDGRMHIPGVMGPDEFHDGYPWSEAPGVLDNAYTNVMTSWLLWRSGEVVETLRSANRTTMLEQLGVSESEVADWDAVGQRLSVPFHEGVISQFAGYERLRPLDLDAYRARYGNIGRLDLILDAEGDDVRRYQVAKQADVLMLFYLLSAEELRSAFDRMAYSLEPELIRRTVQYYSRRVSHGSTLSSVVHAWVLARADRQASWQYFLDALASDVTDTQGGTTREGIHLGAMGGTADLLQRCYTGMEMRGEALWLNPLLPSQLRRLGTSLTFRGMELGVEVDHERVRVKARPGRATPITVMLRGEPIILYPGQQIDAPVNA